MDGAFVRRLLVQESFAYGFTVAFWGSGLLLVEEYGLLHTPGVLSYAAGAVTGFGVLAAASFEGVFATVSPDQSPQYVVLAGIHYLASLFPILLAHVVLLAPAGKFVSLFAVGADVSLVYNAAAAFEEHASERLRQYEQR